MSEIYKGIDITQEAKWIYFLLIVAIVSITFLVWFNFGNATTEWTIRVIYTNGEHDTLQYYSILPDKINPKIGFLNQKKFAASPVNMIGEISVCMDREVPIVAGVRSYKILSKTKRKD